MRLAAVAVLTLALAGCGMRDIREPYTAGVDPSASVPELRAIAMDATNHGETRRAALAALADAAPGDPGTREVVIFLAEARDPWVRAAAVDTLPDLPGTEDLLLDTLLRPLDDPAENVRNAAVRGICPLGERASAAIPALTRLARDEREGSYGTRLWSIRALARVGPEDPEVFDTLLSLLEDGNVGREAADALASFGRRAMPRLVEALDGDRSRRVSGAAWALTHIRGPDEDALDAVRRQLGHEDEHVRFGVACALLHAGFVEGTVPVFSEALAHPDANTRLWAAHSIQWSSGHAEPLIPALRRALQDGDESVRTAARSALETIESE